MTTSKRHVNDNNKNNIRNKVKGSGQECPLYTGKVKNEKQIPPSSE
ncbi:MAG TPA: hypothetical protein VGM18_18140 [Candidatus Sulfotelmatobacter sp.]|jgi:hypothetical protein